ncbi:MAG: haloacid dehalogenase [Acidimicrobiia bacterium]|nr:MAG: haloacid dehalogenase [Acidimicrobiia bacterium]
MNRAVVWDMGGVLYRYFTELLVDQARAEGWLDGLPLGPTGPVPDADYRAMAEGRMDEAEYVRRVQDRLRSVGVDAELYRRFHWETAIRSDVVAMVEELRREDIRQVVLTNDASRWLGPDWRTTWEYSGLFDALVDVAELVARKPDPLPYLEAARAVGCGPRECVFVDDLPVNCRGAEAVGMAAVWFDVSDEVGSLSRLRMLLDR